MSVRNFDGVTFDCALNPPKIQPGLDFSTSDSGEFRIRSGQFQVTAKLRAAGPAEILDQWTVGFIHNVIADSASAFYGRPGAGHKITRAVGRLPALVTVPGHEPWCSAPVPLAGVANVQAAAGNKQVAFELPPLTTRPWAGFPWERNEGGNTLQIKQTTGTTTYRYWVMAFHPGRNALLPLDTGTWEIDWRTAISVLPDPQAGARVLPPDHVAPLLSAPESDGPAPIGFQAAPWA